MLKLLLKNKHGEDGIGILWPLMILKADLKIWAKVLANCLQVAHNCLVFPEQTFNHQRVDWSKITFNRKSTENPHWSIWISPWPLIGGRSSFLGGSLIHSQTWAEFSLLDYPFVCELWCYGRREWGKIEALHLLQICSSGLPTFPLGMPIIEIYQYILQLYFLDWMYTQDSRNGSFWKEDAKIALLPFEEHALGWGGSPLFFSWDKCSFYHECCYVLKVLGYRMASLRSGHCQKRHYIRCWFNKGRDLLHMVLDTRVHMLH